MRASNHPDMPNCSFKQSHSDMHSDMDFDYGDLESPASAEPSGTDAPRVQQLCRQLERAEQDVAAAEEALKQAKSRVFDLQEKVLPALLAEIGTDHFRVPNGGPEVVMKKEVTASLPVKDPQRRAAGIAWLERNGQGSIVKYQATVDFAKGDEHTMKAFQAYMASWERHEMVDCAVEKDVHHGTLTATVKEMLAEGVDFPRELLGVHERRVAKLVKRKTK